MGGVLAVEDAGREVVGVLLTLGVVLTAGSAAGLFVAEEAVAAVVLVTAGPGGRETLITSG